MERSRDWKNNGRIREIYSASFLILDAGCWILDAGYWILDAGCWMLNCFSFSEKSTWHPVSSIQQQLVTSNQMNLTNDTYLRIVNAKMYIDENYHEPIDLEVVSKKAFISKFHFHRLFRKVYRQTPHQYITRKRIDKAKDLLAENKPVTEVCIEVGFESIGSFSILFKKEIGFAPTYYRNMAWLKKQEAKQQPKKFIPHCFIDSFKLDK